MSEQRPTTNTPERDEPTVHHVPRRKKQPLRPARMQINLTSMIDVTFLLLIYFIITANFTFEEGVLIARMPAGTGQAQQQESVEPPPRPLEIRLLPAPPSNVRIHIEGERGINTFTQLARQLEAWQVRDTNPGGIYKPDNPVIIRPVGEVRWQHVVNAFNAAISARYSNVAFGESQTP